MSYIVNGWQGPYHRDLDPAIELGNGPVLGVTPAISHNVNLVRGGEKSIMFSEVINDKGITSGRSLGHEMGHQFGLSHGDKNVPVIPQTPGFPAMGIMTFDILSSNSNDFFIPYHINIIRSRVKCPGCF